MQKIVKNVQENIASKAGGKRYAALTAQKAHLAHPKITIHPLPMGAHVRLRAAMERIRVAVDVRAAQFTMPRHRLRIQQMLLLQPAPSPLVFGSNSTR